MFTLNNKLLIESYNKSIELNVDHDFIILLEREIYKRISEGTLVKNINVNEKIKDYEQIVST